MIADLDGAGGIKANYTRAPAGKMLSMYNIQSSPPYTYRDTYYVFTDALGSTVMLFGKVSGFAKSYSYEEFGKYTSAAGGTDTRFTFTGAPYFSGPGLYQMGARFYNPQAGRFITRDTYKGSIYRPWTQNLYTYCNNNPVNYVDPTGHMSWEAARNSFFQGIGQVFNASNWENSYNVAATYLPTGAKTFAIEGIIGADNYSELTDDEWNSGDIKAAGFAAFNIVTLRSGGKGAGKAEKAYRYVSEGELNVIKATGKIPNVDRAGNLKDIFVSPNKYDTVLEAEKGLQIGKQNPFGPTGSPVYRVEFNMNSVNYRYGGNVEGGTGIEMITEQPIPVDLLKIYQLK